MLGKKEGILLKSRREVLVVLMSLTFFGLATFFPKNETKSDVTQDNTLGSWSGSLGPAAVGSGSSDVDFKSPEIAINLNSSLSQYEAGLNSTSTSGFIRSSVISPPTGTLKKWKQLKLGFRKPLGTNTSYTVDILCGDPAQPGPQCPTLDQPIPGFANVPLDVNDEYTIPPSLTATKIKIRVNFSRPDLLQSPTILYTWQVSWEVNSGVSLTVSKTPNPANPELQGGFDANPGVANNNQVTYTLNYSLDRSVNNLTLELPFPTATYTPSVGSPKNYSVAYVGSSSGSPSGSKVVWNLGNKAAGTVGSVNATFKIHSGPPDGVVFKTKAKIFGSDYSAVTLPDDNLNIQSKAFAYARLIAPEYIAASNNVSYVLQFGSAYYWFQSDMFNPRYEFVYSACMDNTFNPVVSGTGVSVTVDKPNRKITFTPTSPMTFPSLNLDYGVTLKAAASCGATVTGTLTFFSDQDPTFIKTKVVNATFNGSSASNFDVTATPRFNILKDGGPNPTGAGQRVDYNIRLEQRSTVPLSNFYFVDKIPSNATFLSAQMAPGTLFSLNAIPKTWKIYSHTSTGASPPARFDAGWTELQGGAIPCSPECTSPAPANVKWIKVDVGNGNSFNWDRNSNFDQPIVRVSIVTNSGASGTIGNTVTAFAGNICSTGCANTYNITVNNTPYFATNYTPFNASNCTSGFDAVNNPTRVSSGNYYCVTGSVSNSQDGGGTSHGNATNVSVTFRLPNTGFLDSTTPFDPSSAQTFARCVKVSGESTSCPQIAGGGDISNPSWLQPTTNNCVGSNTCCTTGPTCTINWNIPLIYSSYNYPQTLPYQYNFYIRVKTKLGLADQTTICNNLCTLSVTSSPNNPKSIVSPYEVKISATTELNISKVANPTQISYGQSVDFTLTYQHGASSTGSASNLFVMDALPEVTSVIPVARMLYQSQTSSSDYDVFFMTNYSRSGNPPLSTSASWQSIANVAGQENIVDWVMWKKKTPFQITDSPGSLTLRLADAGSPDGIQFSNRAFVGFNNGSDNVCTVCASTSVLIVNPGFSTTQGANVGSLKGFGFATDPRGCVPGTTDSCNTSFLGISGQTTTINSSLFKSFKTWLIDDYSFPSQLSASAKITNYSQMFRDYGKLAVSCDSEVTCLGGSEQAKIYTVSSGNTLQINSISNYSGVPRILFVNEPSGGDALEININFNIGPSTGIIFVVNGHVKINYGVTEVHGVFLVEGQFATGRRTTPVSNKEAGRFAAISIGQDGFARIAYLSENNVRLIKCKDLDCANKDYGYVTTVNNPVSLSMDLYASSPGVDLPKVVVSQVDTSTGKATAKFINCLSEDCLTNNTIVYEDAKDADIIVNTYYGFPSYIMGTGGTSPRTVSFANCLDANCSSPSVTSIDGVGAGNEDKGNEVSYSMDATPATFDQLVATYVDRSAGKSDLWFTKFRWVAGGTTCSQSEFWDCRRITVSPGNVGPYPASTTHPTNGLTKTVYLDTSTKEIKYLSCNSKDCINTSTKVIDCTSGCEGRGYTSIVALGSNAHAVYNTRRDINGVIHNEVKYGFCPTIISCHSSVPWSTYNLTNNIATNAVTYNQSIALGRVTETGFPRIVFFNEDDRSLYYIRCKVINCDTSNANNLVYKKIDDGTAVALADKALTIKGAVSAYGKNALDNKAIKLQRDLFSMSTLQPGEIFIFEPKYYYILKDIIKEPEYIKEAQP